jgi:putative transcriptional regulator
MNLTNHFLIAMPQLDAAPFTQSVVYLCQHSAHGAMGLIINVSAGMAIKEILQQLNIPCELREFSEAAVLVGGPVQPEYGFILHSPAGNWKSSIVVSDDIAITISKDVLTAVAKGDGPSKCLLALGYSEWGPGQLEKELTENSWLTAPANPQLLFDVPLNLRWQKAIEMAGIKHVYDIAQQVGHA